MSATPPPDPKKSGNQDFSGALIWALVAAGVAAFMLYRAFDPAFANSKGLYLIGGAVGAIMAAVYGYGAWTLMQKAKPK